MPPWSASWLCTSALTTTWARIEAAVFRLPSKDRYGLENVALPAAFTPSTGGSSTSDPFASYCGGVAFATISARTALNSSTGTATYQRLSRTPSVFQKSTCPPGIRRRRPAVR